MSKAVVTFGEIMLRLSPPGYLRFTQTDTFNVTYGGGEANVAVSLANFGLTSYFVTKLPANPIGQAALNHLRRYGVDTSHVLRGGKRLGIYFAETGASQRPSVVVYDREGSAMAGVQAEEFDWRELFSGMDWFHFTGITPALGEGPAGAVREAAKTAKAMGLTVSCDLNYRQKLWTPEKAGRVMTDLMDYVDVLVGNEEDAEKVFGLTIEGNDVSSGKINVDGYRLVARQLWERFALKYVAFTLRQSLSASDNVWSGLLFDGRDFYQSRSYQVHLVDRIGAGDAFCGALIYALLKDCAPQKAVDLAVTASCLKHTVPGDFNHVTPAEMESLAEGNESGRVQR